MTTTILFNESQSRIVISCAPDDTAKVIALLESKNIPHCRIGQVATETIQIKQADSELSWPVADLYDDWFFAIRRAVESDTDSVPSL